MGPEAPEGPEGPEGPEPLTGREFWSFFGSGKAKIWRFFWRFFGGWTSGVLGMFLVFGTRFLQMIFDTKLLIYVLKWQHEWGLWRILSHGYCPKMGSLCNCPGENWAIGFTQEKGFRWFTNSICLTERLNQQGFLLQLKWDFYHRAGLSNPTWTEEWPSVDGILLTFSIAWQDAHCCDLS